MLRFFGLILIITSLSCTTQDKDINITPGDYHTAQDRVTAIQVHDIFSPPVASRIYAYSNIAAYEAMLGGTEKYKSLTVTILRMRNHKNCNTEFTKSYHLQYCKYKVLTFAILKLQNHKIYNTELHNPKN